MSSDADRKINEALRTFAQRWGEGYANPHRGVRSPSWVESWRRRVVTRPPPPPPKPAPMPAKRAAAIKEAAARIADRIASSAG
jgi:hypothetical protein